MYQHLILGARRFDEHQVDRDKGGLLSPGDQQINTHLTLALKADCLSVRIEEQMWICFALQLQMS